MTRETRDFYSNLAFVVSQTFMLVLGVLSLVYGAYISKLLGVTFDHKNYDKADAGESVAALAQDLSHAFEQTIGVTAFGVLYLVNLLCLCAIYSYSARRNHRKAQEKLHKLESMVESSRDAVCSKTAEIIQAIATIEPIVNAMQVTHPLAQISQLQDFRDQWIQSIADFGKGRLKLLDRADVHAAGIAVLDSMNAGTLLATVPTQREAGNGRPFSRHFQDESFHQWEKCLLRAVQKGIKVKRLYFLEAEQDLDDEVVAEHLRTMVVGGCEVRVILRSELSKLEAEQLYNKDLVLFGALVVQNGMFNAEQFERLIATFSCEGSAIHQGEQLWKRVWNHTHARRHSIKRKASVLGDVWDMKVDVLRRLPNCSDCICLIRDIDRMLQQEGTKGRLVDEVTRLEEEIMKKNGRIRKLFVVGNRDKGVVQHLRAEEVKGVEVGIWTGNGVEASEEFIDYVGVFICGATDVLFVRQASNGSAEYVVEHCCDFDKRHEVERVLNRSMWESNRRLTIKAYAARKNN